MSLSPSIHSAVDCLIVTDTEVEANGTGPAYDLGALQGRPVMIVLGISEVIEQESLRVSTWGSTDGNDWGAQALFWYPQQFYKGLVPAALDLRRIPGIRFLQARWEVNRWGRGCPRPMFKFSVQIKELPTGGEVRDA